MNNPLVSIVCPMHNCEKFASFTINSILMQDYTNFEVLIIDDCSTDKTEEIVKSFNDDRIKYFKNPSNSGPAYSRNVGLKYSNGEYIAFIDGDDIWYKNKLSCQIQFMLKNNYLFSCTDYEVINEEGKSLGIYITGPACVTNKKFRKTNFVGTSTIIYKKSVFPDLQIPNDIFKRNDYALWLLLSKKAPCYRLPNIHSCYRKTVGSISSGKKIKLVKYHIILYKKLFNYSMIHAFFCSIRNIIYYCYKQLRYKKKII